MKASEILGVVDDYLISVRYSDLNTGVTFGCDCGCGGDYYAENPEAWDDMCNAYDEALANLNAMCLKLGVENDVDG